MGLNEQQPRFTPLWLQWARRLQALAESGMAYDPDQYERERYEQVRAIAGEMLEVASEESLPVIQGLLEGELGHATPKIDVRGAAFRDAKILLVCEKGSWAPPGGWADVGESPSEAVARELLEETGHRATATKLIALYDREKHAHRPHPWHVYKLFFLCELVGEATGRTEADIDGVDFFGEHELPDLDLSRITHHQIRVCFEHWKDPRLPTDFD
jgi:ADP-ribose pyrophosphatase YjhB (NUDIX family)